MKSQKSKGFLMKKGILQIPVLQKSFCGNMTGMTSKPQK